MEITDVRVKKMAGESKIKAMASIVIDGEFIVRDLRVVEGTNGLFVAMPSRKLPDGEFRDIAHPITAEARDLIQNKVLEAFAQSRE